MCLLFCLLVISPAGCDRDDTVRGAGSIDIPKESLKYQVPTKATPAGNKLRHTH